MSLISLYNKVIKGYVEITGNSLGLAGSGTSLRGGILNFTTLSSTTTTSWSANGSSAYLNLPSGTTVLYAGLFWSGSYRVSTPFSADVSASIGNSITFQGPDNINRTISRDVSKSQTITRGSDYYSNYADVTTYVQSARGGNYKVSGVPGILVPNSSNVGDGDNFYLGWTMIVVVGSLSEKYRIINVWAACDVDTSTTVATATLTGFATGSLGPFSGNVFISAGSGNPDLSGDQLRFGPTTSNLTSLSTTSHPQSNFFCGVISNRLGNLNTIGTFGTSNNTAGSTPSTGNRSMYDITGADVSSTLTANQTSAVIQIYSTGDGIIANSLASEIVLNDNGNLAANLICTPNKGYAQVHDLITYTIPLKNTGNLTANNVVFVNTIPAEVTFVDNSFKINNVTIANANPAAPNGVTIGNIAANAVTTLAFTVSVISIPANSTINTNNGIGYSFVPIAGQTIYAYDSSISATTTIPYANLNVNKTSDNYAYVNDTLSYTLSLSNTGNTTANNVTIFDTIPTNTTFVTNSLKLNGVTITGANPNSGYNIGTVPIGSTTITFDVTVNALPSPNVIKNSARVSYKYTVDPTTPNGISNNINTNITTTTINHVFLNANKISNKNYVKLYDELIYTIALNNEGNIGANNVIIKDTIPVETKFIEGSLKLNGVALPNLNLTTGANIGNIPVGLTTLTFNVQVITVPSPNIIKNQANISYTFIPDLVNLQIISGNTSTNNSIVVVNYAKILISKTVNKPSVKIGDEVMYTFVLSNIGNVTATNVNIQDILPMDLTFVDNSITINNVATNYTLKNLNLSSISSGEVMTITFKALLI